MQKPVALDILPDGQPFVVIVLHEWSDPQSKRQPMRGIGGLTMRDGLKSCWKIFGLRVYIAWLDLLLCVVMPLLKYIGYIVIVVTVPLWLPIYWFVKGKEIKERENNADR
jgi:hypothetical protein